MRIIAMLPTGDWAEVAPVKSGEVYFYAVADTDYEEFRQTGDTTLGKRIGVYSADDGWQDI